MQKHFHARVRLIIRTELINTTLAFIISCLEVSSGGAVRALTMEGIALCASCPAGMYAVASLGRV